MFQVLSVSQDGRHIVNADGTPFFYLADTAWELFHKLDLSDAERYLADRAKKGFTAIQAVALAELDGLGTPNAYGKCPLKRNADGRFDPDMPDLDGEYTYWDHVDAVVDMAARYDLYIALLPTWGDKYNRCWGIGPEIFTEDNAFPFGRWIGARYRNRPNIIWVLGGDRALTTRRHFNIINAMALGIRKATGTGQLITFHPTGGHSSGESLHEETWLDFNMLQTGHSRHVDSYKMVEKEYARLPAKPVIDAEPGYEHHPESFEPRNGYLDAADCRNFAYQNLFSGACGHAYGDHSIWAMVRQIPTAGFQPGHFCMTWDRALDAPGAYQMQFAKRLLLSRDFLSLVPNPNIVAGQMEGLLHVPVLQSPNTVLAYASQGQPFTFKKGYLGLNSGIASWYNPRLGEFTDKWTIEDASNIGFTPPTAGRGQDWVLVIDIVRKTCQGIAG